MAPSKAKANYDATHPTLGGRVSIETYTYAVKNAAARGITKGQFVELAVTQMESVERAFAAALAKHEAKHAAEVAALRGEIASLSSAVVIERPCRCGRAIKLDLRTDYARSTLADLLFPRTCMGEATHDVR